MKQTIYIDVLIAVNLFVNYFILLATAKFLYLKLRIRRLIFGEALGAVFSLYILLPNANIFLSLIIKFFISLTIVWVTFGIKKPKVFWKALACFYSVSFAFSGIMFALWCVFRPNGMLINNSVVYFNISPLMLIASTLISYIVIEAVNKILGKKDGKNTWCDVKINFFGKSVIIKAKVDTGNSLREPFSNIPVIVVKKGEVAELIPYNLNYAFAGETFSEAGKGMFENFKNKIRIIPFKTVSGDGLLPAFKPDGVEISGGPQKEAYIAVCSDEILSGETSALINPELID